MGLKNFYVNIDCSAIKVGKCLVQVIRSIEGKYSKFEHQFCKKWHPKKVEPQP